jgi:hypothetical protein
MRDRIGSAAWQASRLVILGMRTLEPHADPSWCVARLQSADNCTYGS